MAQGDICRDVRLAFGRRKSSFVGRGAKEKITRPLLTVPGQGFQTVENLNGSHYVGVGIFGGENSESPKFTQSVITFDCSNANIYGPIQVQAQLKSAQSAHPPASIQYDSAYFVSQNNTLIEAPFGAPFKIVVKSFPKHISILSIHVRDDIVLLNMRDTIDNQDKFQFFKGPVVLEDLTHAIPGSAQFIGEQRRENVVQKDKLGTMTYQFYIAHQNGKLLLKTYTRYEPYFSVRNDNAEQMRSSFPEKLKFLANVGETIGEESRPELLKLKREFEGHKDYQWGRNKDIEISTESNIKTISDL